MLRGKLQSRGIRVIHAPQGPSGINDIPIIGRVLKALFLTPWLMQQIRKEEATILHFFLPEAYLLGGLCAVLVRRKGPMLMSRRSLNIYQANHSLFRIIELWLHRRMTVILGNSKAIIAELHEKEGVPEEKLCLIYNGIDLEPFQASHEGRWRHQKDICKSSFVMVIVANLISYKGHSDLLKALAFIKKGLPPQWKLLCVGRDDGLLKQLSEEAVQRGIGEHVKWLGMRMDVPDILRIADIGILCSHEEGFPNSVLEYMAAGLPVVATSVGGIPEAVSDGIHGLLVPPHDPRALGEKILLLANNPELRTRLGRSARRRVIERFSLESCVSAYHELYLSVIKKYSQISLGEG